MRFLEKDTTLADVITEAETKFNVKEKSDSIYIVKQTGRKRLYNIAQGKKPDALSASGRCCRIPEEKDVTELR